MGMDSIVEIINVVLIFFIVVFACIAIERLRHKKK